MFPAEREEWFRQGRGPGDKGMDGGAERREGASTVWTQIGLLHGSRRAR